MVRRHAMPCCALCQITASNNDSLEAIKHKINTIKDESKNPNWKAGENNGYGQRAAFVIVAPGEDLLENNVIKLGFEKVAVFDRRVGYMPGILKMYFLNW